MGSEDFKSFCRALEPSGVGSIPTRSRQSRFWLIVLIALAWTGLPAGAVGQEVDSTDVGAPVESIKVPVESETIPLKTAVSGVKSGNRSGTPSVAWVTIRSGILPGWGQMANRKPIKAILFGGAYAGFAVSAILAESDRGSIQKRIDGSSVEPPDTGLVEELNSAVNRRNFGMWMMGATMVFSMLDAYVDAHFFNYDDQWRAGPVFDGGLTAVSIGYRF